MTYIGLSPPNTFTKSTSQTFTGNGSTTAFTLQTRVSSPEDLEVFVSNVQQQPTESYTIGSDGVTMTFSEAPPSGTFYVIYRTVAQQAGTDTGASRLGENNTFTGTQTFNADVSLLDNVKVNIGSDSDGYIRHTGSAYQLVNSTGSIVIKNLADNQDVVLQTDNGSGATSDYIRCDGSEGEVSLYHYGSEKFATTSTGVAVTGNVDMNGGELILDADADTSITADTDDEIHFKVAGSDHVKIKGGTNVVHVIEGSSGQGTPHTNSSLVLESDGETGINILSGNTNFAGLVFGDDGDNDIGFIQYKHDDNYLRFGTNTSERMRIDSSGSVGIGVYPATFTTGTGIHLGDNRALGLGDGANGRPDFQIACVNGLSLDFRCGNGADTADLTINPSGVFSGDFNDTSDERLKENIKDIADNQIAVLKQLRAVTFDWKEKNKGSDTGFIAQEVKKVLPNDVHYQNPEIYESESDLPVYTEQNKEDGVIPDGKKVGDKVDDTIKVGDMVFPNSMMAINLQGIVAVLTKALQETVARLEVLESK